MHYKPLPLPMQGDKCELNRLPSACNDYEERKNVTETEEWKEEVKETISAPKLINADDLYAVFRHNKMLCMQYASILNDAMIAHKITSSARICAFLATIAVESGYLKYTEEISSGAQYEGRKDLGNTQKGDGVRYKGRGLIQITGRYNYEKVSKAFGIDFVAEPQKLAQLPHSVYASAWWWQKHGLNSIADTEDLKAIRRKVNGGLNGYSEFVAVYKNAQKIFR